MSNLEAKEYKRFEDIKIIRANKSQYWSARELAPVLDYFKWENFAKVIQRAVITCQNSGHTIEDEFPEVRKIVKAGATTKTILANELYRRNSTKT